VCNKTRPCAPGLIRDSRMESVAQNCRFCDVRNAHRINLSAEYGWQFSLLIHLRTFTSAAWRSPNLCYPLPSPLRQYLANVILQYDSKTIHYYCKVRYSSPSTLRAQGPLMVQGLHITKPSRSHSDTPHSLGLLWTSDQPVAETSA